MPSSSEILPIAFSARLTAGFLAIALLTVLPAWGETSCPPLAADTSMPGPWDAVDHVLMPVTLVGHSTRLVIDTGASTNLLPLDYAKFPRGGKATKMKLGNVIWNGLYYLKVSGEFGPGVPGLIGAGILSEYDMVFDGPHHALRMYQTAGSAKPGMPTWFPPDVARKDVVALLPWDHSRRPFFPVSVNGRPMRCLFDSGAAHTVLNLAAARQLGYGTDDPRMRLLPHNITGEYLWFTGQRIWRIPHVVVQLGDQRIDTPTNVVEHDPDDQRHALETPEISLGLDALKDRVFYISNSSQSVAIGPDHPSTETPPLAPAAETALAPEDVTRFLAVEKALGKFWRKPENAALLKTATAGAHDHFCWLDEYRLKVAVDDYPKLVRRSPPLAAVFGADHFSPASYETMRVALYNAAAILAYDEAMGMPLPPAGTILGDNLALAHAHRDELASVGIAFPMPADHE